MGILLDVQELHYAHADGTKALDNVSFQLREHESLAVFGPNGSGKTTLLLHLNGTLSGQGRIWFSGTELTKATVGQIRRRVGLVFQDADQQLFMPTVLEDVTFGPLNLGWPRELADQRARQALEQAGIGANLFRRAPFHLSAGEKRRVALAGVLVMQPELLLLDEPTSSLDPPGQRALVRLLKSLPQPKIVATHDVPFAAAIARRAIFLENGLLVADGDLDETARQFAWNPYC